mgnify:CR=1 FL=1
MKIKIRNGEFFELEIALLGSPDGGNCNLRYSGGAGLDVGTWVRHGNSIEVEIPRQGLLTEVLEQYSSEITETADTTLGDGVMQFVITEGESAPSDME